MNSSSFHAHQISRPSDGYSLQSSDSNKNAASDPWREKNPKIAKKRKFLVDPPLNPDIFFNEINRLNSQAQNFYALLAAKEIQLFDHLNHPVSCAELQRIYPRQEMVLPLLKTLVNSGFLHEEEGKYFNTSLTSTYFVSFSPYYQGAYLDKIKTRMNDLWVHLPEVVRDGPVVYNKKDFFCSMCLPPMAENAMTGRLQHTIRSIVSLPEFLHARRMLDLGGGHGLYAIALASLKHDLNCIVFDLPEVIDVTCDYIIANDMDEQVKVLSGDFFTDNFGSGYDIIFSSSNPSGKNVHMIPKIYDALNPGGLFVNIQSGDTEIDENPLSLLESRMWVLEGEPEWKSHRGKMKHFLSHAYTESLHKAGFEIRQVETIHDGYFENYSVTMLICKKNTCSDPCRKIQLSFIQGDGKTKTMIVDLSQKEINLTQSISSLTGS